MSLLVEFQRIHRQTTCGAHRHLLLIETSVDDIDLEYSIRPIMEKVYPGCIVVAGALTNDLADRADQISRHLGTEHQAVLFDASRRFDPGLLAAVASTITAGGIMVIVTPTFALWPLHFTHRDKTTVATSRVSETASHHLPDPGTSSIQEKQAYQRSRFIERFITIFVSAHSQPDSQMTRLTLAPTVELLPARHHKAEADVTSHRSCAATSDRSRGFRGSPWQVEQEQLLQALLGSVQRHEARVFIVEAKRGRGKSALLGRLAARLDAAHLSWQVTSPRRRSVDSLERLWRLEAWHDGGTALLPWIPTDQVSVEPETILFVDEAADVPLPQLLTWASQRMTLILATTTQGYEGSGRGFSTRFYPLLTHAGATWRRFTLQHPVRFGSGDPLEAFIARVLLLDANAQKPGLDPSNIDFHQCVVSRWLQDDLLEDEDRLAAIFGLLREAHYQTTPMDLLHLLDADNLRLYAVSHSSTVLAVAMIAEEGCIAQPFHEPIMSGRRRLKDQLLPQLLARMANQPEVLHKRYLRIVRIAVVPEARRRGFASQLLRYIEALHAAEFDAIGASYSQDHTTASFWRKCGFTTFHEGFRAHPRSGHRTAAVLRNLKPGDAHELGQETITEAVEAGLTTACAILQANKMSAVCEQTSAAAQVPDINPLSARNWQLVARFSEGARSWHDTRAALLHLWKLDPERQADATLDSLESAVCADLHSRPGRKRREAAMRVWARDTLGKLQA